MLDIIRPLLGRATLRGHEARRGLETFAHHAAAALGLGIVTVEWSAGIGTAAINQHGRIILSDIADDATVTREQFCRWVGFVTHELLHRRYTDFSANDGRSYVDNLHNAVEDAWIETRGIRETLLGNIQPLLSTLIDGMSTEALGNVQAWDNPAQYPYSLAVFLRDHATVKVPVPQALLPVYTEARRRLSFCASSTDTLEVARWVYEQMRLTPEQKPDDKPGDKPGQPGNQPGQPGNQPGQPGDQPGTPGDQPGDQQGDDAGQPGDKPADQPGSAAGKPGDKPGQPTVPGFRRPVNASADANSPEVKMDGGGPGDFRPGLYPARSRGEVIPPTPIAGGLRFQVRRLFERTGHEDLDACRRAGTLDRRSLHRVIHTDRVFARRVEDEGVEAALVIVIDLSGSMAKERIQIAAPACAALALVAEEAGAAVAVIGFNYSVLSIKSWEMPARRADAIIRDLATTGSTNDYAGIRHAHDMLLRHPAEKKVCLVLSDGDGAPDLSRQQVQAGKNLGIQTIGIGIQHRVDHVYGEGSPRVDRLADLGRVIFQKVQA